MGDAFHHAKVAHENLLGAAEELRNRRYSNVGLLCLRALEQAIEACASKEGLHFHEHPRTAHKNRRSWLQRRHQDLLHHLDQLWGIYGALGYGGLNGDRAKQAVTILNECLDELCKRENIAVRGL